MIHKRILLIDDADQSSILRKIQRRAKAKNINLDFDQLIWEFGNANNPDWVHVSYISPELNRKQVFKATKNKQNKTIYVNYNENKLQS